MNFKLDARERFVTFRLWLLFVVFVGWIFPAPSIAAEETTIVVFGDSLVAGYGLAPGEAFPDKLAKALTKKGYAVNIVNAGVSGDTTTSGLARLDWSIGEEADAVILELGANDALRGISPEITRRNLDAMLQRLQQRKLPVIIAGMLAPPNLGADYGSSFNGIYKELAVKYDQLLYPFFLDGVAAVERLNQSDGIHPTSEGIELMVQRFLPIAEKLMQKLGAN